MKSKRREAYRDGLLSYTEGEVIDTPEAVVEVLYDAPTGGEKLYFAEIKGTVFCAHGSTIEEAIEDARLKDTSRKITEDELAQYRKPDFKFSVPLFRRLTGACKLGIEAWLKERDIPKNVTMTLAQFKKAGGGEWATKLESSIHGVD